MTEDRMPKNTYLYEKRMFTNIANAEVFGVGKERID